jgi:hypothetical protein
MMSNQISSLEKTDSDRMLKESKAEAAAQKARKALDQKDQQSTARNNDSDIAPEKDKNDVMRGHE